MATKEEDFFDDQELYRGNHNYKFKGPVLKIVEAGITRRKDGNPISLAAFARKLKANFEIPLTDKTVATKIKLLAGGTW